MGSPVLVCNHAHMTKTSQVSHNITLLSIETKCTSVYCYVRNTYMFGLHDSNLFAMYFLMYSFACVRYGGNQTVMESNQGKLLKNIVILALRY